MTIISGVDPRYSEITNNTKLEENKDPQEFFSHMASLRRLERPCKQHVLSL